MKMGHFFALLPLAVFVAAISCLAAASEGSRDVHRISIQELKSCLESEHPQVIDVRDYVSWSKAETKIRNAIRENPEDVDSWAGKYSKNKLIVVY